MPTRLVTFSNEYPKECVAVTTESTKLVFADKVGGNLDLHIPSFPLLAQETQVQVSNTLSLKTPKVQLGDHKCARNADSRLAL